jgi:hypothetical protein
MTGYLYKEFKLNIRLVLIFLLTYLFFSACPIFAVSESKDDDTIGQALTMILGVFCIFTFISAGCIQSGVFNGDDRKKWVYFVTSTPSGIKGQIGAKYLFTMLFVMFVVTLETLKLALAEEITGQTSGLSVLLAAMFYVQLFMRAVEYPLIVRFGAKMGSMVKITAVCVIILGVIIYALFGDTSVFASMDTFWERMFAFVGNPDKLKKLLLWTGIGALAVLPLYYISYRISVMLYLKGAENYAK